MIISRPLNPREPDLLPGNETKPLRFLAPDGSQLSEVQAPAGGWTHDGLEAAVQPDAEPWDAFLGDAWIGSSEL